MTIQFSVSTYGRPSSLPKLNLPPRPGVAGAVVSAVVAMLVNAQLARATRRHRSRGSPPLPSHLRRDIGLIPAEELRTHWDFR